MFFNITIRKIPTRPKQCRDPMEFGSKARICFNKSHPRATQDHLRRAQEPAKSAQDGFRKGPGGALATGERTRGHKKRQDKSRQYQRQDETTY